MMEMFKILIVMVFIQTYTYAKINQPKILNSCILFHEIYILIK